MKGLISNKKAAKTTTQGLPTGRSSKLSKPAKAASATPSAAVGSGSPQTSCCSSSPAARIQDKTSSPEPSPDSASNQTFPFSGQRFSHSLGRVLVPLMMAMGLGPHMGDGGKKHERSAILEKALKSANLNDARSNWSVIVKKYPLEMKNLRQNVKNSLHNTDRVRIYSEFDLQYLLYLTIIFLAGQPKSIS